ncbi:MAG: response regulator [Deltaproteobacteria bacterium]|jgi:two-component system, chemotaxis family, chemotaxis protein CheY|nr:response regulator [Deltaproteobacteria bacterium]MBT4525832.1 response regulator [Deltaproteobacteria bacterium]
MKILIVDDDISTRQLLHAILMNFATCDMAVDGQKAVELVAQAIEKKEIYDIIFLDIMMPELNGHEALLEIRKLEDSNNIHIGNGSKVVMQTCLDDKENILSSFREGCEYYIMKPYNKLKILELIEKMGYTV